jgi:3-(3-hydroxy-phenyl)propionate hydroxylase
MAQRPTGEYEVVVVGAGPTGLTLANLLAAEGVSVLVLERNPSTVQEPRAVSIDDESLRTMQALGLAEEVLMETIPGYGSHYLDPRGRCFARVEPQGQPYGFPRRNAFRQPILEAQLMRALEARPTADLTFSRQFQRFSQTQKGVEVSWAGADGRAGKVRCSYLVGCDGASSDVRRQIGARLDGATFGQRWLIVDLEETAGPQHTEVFCDPSAPGITLPGPGGRRRYEFRLRPDEVEEQVVEPANVRRRLSLRDADPQARIVRTAVYHFHARLADRWRSGRVFLAGDAAHLTPPFAGQGMNTGIRDARNLAWKLAAVTKGLLGAGLLDSYEPERKSHAAAMIQLALWMGRVMAPAGRASAALSQAALRCTRLWPSFNDHIVQMRFKPRPRFRQGFLGHGPRRLIGEMFPQPWIVDERGERRRLDDVIGPGFCIVSCGPAAAAALEGLQGAVWSRLGASRLHLADAPACSAHPLRLASFAAPEDAGLVSKWRDRLLLLRPDRYVLDCWAPADSARAADWLEALIDGLQPHPEPSEAISMI